MSLNHFIKIYFLIFKTRYRFCNPQKKKILFFDNSHTSLIINKFKINKNKYEILYTRLEEINLPILIRSIKKHLFKINLKKYYLEYIKFVGPKKVITFIDNNILFYQLKKYFRSIEFISIQNGHRTEKRDFILELKKKQNNKNLLCDKIFIANLGYGDLIKKYINCRTIPLGYFKNNFVKINNRQIQKKSMIFISQFRKNEITSDHFIVEKKILPLVNKFCIDNKINLYILGCSNNYNLEKNFFESLLVSSSFIFQRKLDFPKNYNFIDKFEIVVFIDSTLGYESIARKKKVAVFSNRRLTKVSSSEKFGWPVKYKNKGYFYSNNKNFNQIEINRILNNVLKINQKKWNKRIFPKLEKISIYNYGNNILKKKLGFN